jgi:hypothetical protein
MGIPIPFPVLLLVAAGAEAGALVSIAHRHWIHTNFSGAFICTVALNTFLWMVYVVVIYPNFLSPIRRLPTPKVSNSSPRAGASVYLYATQVYC